MNGVLKVPGDPLDDVAADVPYGIYTFIASAEKPQELVARGALKSLPAANRRCCCSSIRRVTRGDIVGRYCWSDRPTVEQCRCLDIASLVSSGLFRYPSRRNFEELALTPSWLAGHDGA